MLAEKLAEAGSLQGVLQKLQNDVREAPGDARLRTFLFQILTVMGDWERALKQLQTAATLDESAVPMAHSYRELIRCELQRSEVFAGRMAPVVLGEPSEWMVALVKALELTALGEHSQAEALRAEALEGAPATAGVVNGEPFQWIADADSRMGPVLEAVLLGRYCWIPFDHIEQLTIEKPTDLRDLVWLPAVITLRGQEPQVAFLPARYPGSEKLDDATRLGRTTTWTELGPQTFCGSGQRMLATDSGDVPLFELRQLKIGAQATAADTAHA
jgi:type VI secretion system protein ImpE